MLTITAPAKLNLTFEALEKRPDGYHEVRSIMQSISLCDRITFQHGTGTAFTCSLAGWDATRSLVSGAVEQVREATGNTGGVRIHIEKRIPLVAGVGGDSSDAAAVLKGLDRLWGLGLAENKLLEMAAQLGSDVPFFIRGGTVLAAGRGEILTPLPSLSSCYAVVIIPPVPTIADKTRQLYAALKPEHFTGGQITAEMADAIRSGGNIAAVRLFNVFEKVAFDIFPGLGDYRQQMLSLGADNVHLCGSGPALFTLVRDGETAEGLAAKFQGAGMEAYAVESNM